MSNSADHRDQDTADGIHIISRWEFDDTTERDNASYVLEDLGGVARVGTEAPYDFYLLSDPVGPTFVALGEVGPQGPQGAAGPQGPQGAAGAQGPQGTAGAQGPQGDQGAAGAQGPQGTAGAQGPQGDQGAAGAQGPQGTSSGAVMIFPMQVNLGATGNLGVIPAKVVGVISESGYSAAASLAATVTAQLLFPIPRTLPGGTATLVFKLQADGAFSSSEDAVLNPVWDYFAPSDDLSVALGNNPGNTTVTWTAGDAVTMKEVPITLTVTAGSAIAAQGNLAVDLNFVASGGVWTLASQLYWLVYLTWV